MLLVESPFNWNGGTELCTTENVVKCEPDWPGTEFCL